MKLSIIRNKNKSHSHTEETKKKISKNNARYWLGKKKTKVVFGGSN